MDMWSETHKGSESLPPHDNQDKAMIFWKDSYIKNTIMKEVRTRCLRPELTIRPQAQSKSPK